MCAHLPRSWFAFGILSISRFQLATCLASLRFLGLRKGHTGVALFMTLSGYLFTRIVGDGKIDLKAFATNRVLRLAPLLIVAFCFYFVIGQTTTRGLLVGFVLPTWPGGAWLCHC